MTWYKFSWEDTQGKKTQAITCLQILQSTTVWFYGTQCSNVKVDCSIPPGWFGFNCIILGLNRHTLTQLAFSKRFVGAGHSEEGGGPGGEGTLPSARRGGIPLEKFFEISMLKGAIWCSLGGS